MATAASINTNFTASTANFEKGSKRVEKIAQGLGKNIGSVASSFLPNFGTIVTGAIAGFTLKKITDSFKRELDELGALVDQSINLGIAANELQKLNFAAGQAGVGAQEMSTAIGKMSDTIAAAADGDVKEAVDAMTALGLSAQQLVGMSPDQQLLKVADAFAAIDNTSRRIQVARDIFGRAGVNLIATLENGSAGFAESARRAEELGANLTKLDFAMSDLAGDALGEVSFAFSNLKKQFVADIAPAVTVLSEAFATFIGSAAQGTDQSYALSRSVIVFFGGLADGINEVGFTFRELDATFLTLRGTVNQAMSDWSLGAIDLADLAAEQFNEAAQQFRAVQMERRDPVSAQWIRELDAVISRAQKSANRGDEIRTAVRRSDFIAASERVTRERSIQPAAVQLGTTAAIEAINKAGVGKAGEAVAKNQLRELKDLNAGVDRVERAIGNLAFEPANLN